MKLTIEQIAQITQGAVRVTEDTDGIHLHRFTEEQERLYEERSDKYYERAICTAGMKFVFKTNSQSFSIKAYLKKGCSRTYFSFDVFKDGELLGYMDNFSNVDLPDNYANYKLPLGEYSQTIDLGEGDKIITVCLPWNLQITFHEIAIDDGAYIEALPTQKKMLIFGDSITQGFDALRSSERYAGRLAESLGAEEFNKGVGGEIFFPELAQTDEDFVPDYISVAYGTNDWSHSEKEIFMKNCRKFYETLSQKYPNAKIFAITPIWRKDLNKERPFGLFEEVAKGIEEAVKDLENVSLIYGFDLVPKEEAYFGDLKLHPNNQGFNCYFENLYAQIEKILVEK